MMGASGGSEETGFGTRDFYVALTPLSVKQQFWLDGYDMQEDIVIEDFAGEINHRLLLRMLDQYPMRMQIKGGTVQFVPKRIWISSNLHPRDWYNIPGHPYEGGPLERRLQKDDTGRVIRKAIKWIKPEPVPAFADLMELVRNNLEENAE